MIRSDVLVVGAGLSGLMAAYVSAKRGQKVTLLTWGEGTLTVNSGVIDILGYDEDHRPVGNPRQGIASLPDEHSYKKLGIDTLEAAMKCFLELTSRRGLPYEGSLDSQLSVLTAIGTAKPTGFAPKSLVATGLADGKKKVVAVGIKGLKDFYGDIMVENLKKTLGADKAYSTQIIDTGLMGGRDITTQDVARWLDTPEGRDSFLSQLGTGAEDTLFVVPQVLGSHGQSVYHEVAGSIKGSICETTCLPPSVNGIRLCYLFRDELRELGVDIVESSMAVGAETAEGHAKAVIAKSASNERRYYADKFILATGGFYSGGLLMRDFDNPYEPVFHLPVESVKGEDAWTNEELLGDKAQGYAKTGVRTDASLRPVDEGGTVVLDNVYVVGGNLSGYDFCFEHSGNGITIASAYKAASL